MRAPRVPLGIARRADALQVPEHGNGRVSSAQRSGKHERLKRRSRLAPAADGPVVRAPRVAGSADECQHVARGRIESDECRFEARFSETIESRCDRPLCGILYRQAEGRAYLPVRRMIAAEL